jgi:hypothetical protein
LWSTLYLVKLVLNRNTLMKIFSIKRLFSDLIDMMLLPWRLSLTETGSLST